MRHLALILFPLLVAGAAAGAEGRLEVLGGSPWRIYRDDGGVVRVTRADVKDAARVPVARGGTPGGFLFFERGGEWWLLIAHADRIVAGRSKIPEGPYLDHTGRTMLDGGGTPVVLPLPNDPERSIHTRRPGDGADLLRTSDGEFPLVWPPDGYPIAGPPGTLDSWQKPCEHPLPFPGPWRHGLSLGSWARIDPNADGTYRRQPKGTFWKVGDGALTITWPRHGAPGGAWIDRCRLSRDGRYYLGRNQWQATIYGEVEDASDTLGPGFRAMPVAALPERVVAPEGKLSLWADFADVRGERIVLYVVNRTAEPLSLPAMDGDIYVKLEAMSPEGEWERAQAHLADHCGTRHLFQPEIPPGRFATILGLRPSTGEERDVRYRTFGEVDLVSNPGRGRVDPRTIEACRRDKLALSRAGFGTVSEVALGEVEVPGRAEKGVRAFAVRQLARFPDEPQTGKILRHLLSDPDPMVSAEARRVLESLK